MPSLKPQGGATASHGKSASAHLEGTTSDSGTRNDSSQKPRQQAKAPNESSEKKAKRKTGDIDAQIKGSRGSVSARHISIYTNSNVAKNEGDEIDDGVSDIPNIKITPRKKPGVPSGRKRTYVVEPDQRVIRDNNVIIDTSSEMGEYFKQRMDKKEFEPRVTKSDKAGVESEKIIRQRKQLKASLPRFKDDLTSSAGKTLPPLKDVAKTKGLTPRTGAYIAQNSGRANGTAQGLVRGNKSPVNKGTDSANNKIAPKASSTSRQTHSKSETNTLAQKPPDVDAMQKYVAAHENFHIREMKARARVGGRDYVQRGDPTRMGDYEQIRQSLHVGVDKTVYPAYSVSEQDSEFTTLTTITLPDLKTTGQGENVHNKVGSAADNEREHIKKGQQTATKDLDDQRNSPIPNVALQKEAFSLSPKERRGDQKEKEVSTLDNARNEDKKGQNNATILQSQNEQSHSPNPNVSSEKALGVLPNNKPKLVEKHQKSQVDESKHGLSKTLQAPSAQSKNPKVPQLEVFVTSPAETPSFLRGQLFRKESQITDVTSRNSSAVHSGRASLAVSPIINITSPEPIKEEPPSGRKKKANASKDSQKDKGKTKTLTTKSSLSHNSSKSRLSQNSTKSRLTIRPTSAPEEDTDSKPPSGKVANQDGSERKRENSDPGDSATASQRTSSKKLTLRVKPVPRGFLLSPNAITETSQPQKSSKVKSTPIGKSGKVYIQRRSPQKTQQSEIKKERKTKLTLPKIKDKRVSPNVLSDVEVDAADSIQRSLRLYNL